MQTHPPTTIDLTNTVNNSLGDALGLAPLDITTVFSEVEDDGIHQSIPVVFSDDKLSSEEQKEELSEDEKQARSDFDVSRKNMLDILEQGTLAYKKAVAVAIASEKPLSFDSVSKMTEALTKANRELLALHEAKQLLCTDSAVIEEKSTTTNNTLIVGSAAELLEFVEARKKAKQAAINKLPTDENKQQQ